jgi:hypothetical protein
MSSSTGAGFYSIALLVVGVPFTLIGLAVSGIILLSGPWGIGHGFPLLLISLPMLIIGILALRRCRRLMIANRTASKMGTHN